MASLKVIVLITAFDDTCHQLLWRMMYFLFQDRQKTQWLLSEARRDVFFAPIVEDLEAFGFEIRHSVFEGNGVYYPYSIKTNASNFEQEFLKLFKTGIFTAKFKIGYRHGAGAALFYFLHELVHFKQDIDGRLNAGSILDLECEAAVESICTAYRLKQNGYEMAWRGVLGSFNCRGIAINYAREQNRENLRLDWYKSKQAKYYSKRASQKPVVLCAEASPPYLWKKLIA